MLRVVADVLLRGATVVDGLGGPGFRADTEVSDGRISAVRREGTGDRAGAKRTIDADGLVVAPGFIDMHSHADFTLPSYPGALNSISQGVTTEVLGNCGYSPAPLAEDDGLRSGQRAAGIGLGPDLDWRWRSFADYVGQLDAARPAVNSVLLVGHGTLRLGVVGGEDRPASEDELARMRAHVSEALAAGAFGMSTGLVYPPGSFSTTDEIVAIARPLAEADAFYASHIRSEGDNLTDALREATEIGRRVRVRVEVSHLKAAGRQNHGRMGEAHAVLDGARALGVRVTQDAYPYTAGSTLLTQLLPPWVQDGGIEALIARLRVDEVRDRIRREVATGLPDWMSYAVVSGGWDKIIIAAVGTARLRSLEGRTVAEAALERGVDPLNLVFDTLIEDDAATTMIVFLMAAPDVEAALSHPSTAIGSDQFQVTSRDAHVHPRCYGTFARVLGRIVREQRMLTLPEAIRRMTSLPASIVGLGDRGRVAEGYVADLVVFDPDRVADTSTYAEPTSLATGVEAVLVGGEVAVEGGEVVNPRLGRVLRPGT